MEPRTDEHWQVDGRGVYVATISVDFFSNSEAWEYLRRLKVPVRQDEELWTAAFYGLPQDRKAGERYLSVFVHVHADEQVHWMLRLERMPTSEPPEVIAASSTLVGGYPGVLERMEKELSPSFLSSIENVGVKVSYILPYEQWTPSLAGHARPASRSQATTKLTLAQEVWHVEGAADDLKTISVNYEEQAMVVSASGDCSLPFSSRILEQAENRMWERLRPLLEEARS